MLFVVFIHHFFVSLVIFGAHSEFLFKVTLESVFAAIKAADAYGRYYLGEE